MEDCRGLEAGIDVPQDKARQYVPAEFEMDSAVPFTALFTFVGLACERGTTGNATLEDVYLLWAGAAVTPRPDSWDTNDGFHEYVYDFLVSHDELRSSFESVGLNATTAEISIDSVDVPDGIVREEWVFESATLGLEFGFKHRNQAEEEDLPNRWFVWFGNGPFTRFEMIQEAKRMSPYGLDDDVAHLSGSSPFHQVTGDAGSFRANTMTQGTITFGSRGETYSSNEENGT